ncbi:hypothetical protein [Seonamhaeicola sp. S2-3]
MYGYLHNLYSSRKTEQAFYL